MEQSITSKFGPGPWFVALLFNESVKGGSKRKTELRVHTYAYQFAMVRNVLEINDNWITIQLVGPFGEIKNAMGFYTLWCSQARSKGSRIQRGFKLMQRFGKQYQLTMWYETRALEKIMLERKKQREKQKSKQLCRSFFYCPNITPDPNLDLLTIRAMHNNSSSSSSSSNNNKKQRKTTV